jgi:UDP-N-acetylmuramate dehydrogenase
MFEGEKFDQVLAPLTSWHIGGPAQRLYYPPTIDKLGEYLSYLPADVSLTWLGLGSNVLVRDGGIQGAVICTRQLQELQQLEDGSIYAQAGVTCAKLARFATQKGFPDAAFFAGIPGTVGGALAMNAGAFGGETWEWVAAVNVVNRQGQQIRRESAEYDVAYRSVQGKQPEQTQESYTSGIFRFPSRVLSEGTSSIKELLRKRNQTQPIGTLNCGSVYRNPPGDFAARLIEACQLKGYQVGNAVISQKHANFIINKGSALATDVEKIMTTIESCVFEKFNVQLHAEVRILGQREP